MASVEKLYKNYDLLSGTAADSATKERAFLEILGAVKGSTQQKQLACQFIVKFFRLFPTLKERAIDAQIDLCEDEEQSIRRYAIKELPNFCRDEADNVAKVADILAQLVETEDHVELQVVQGSLFQLLRSYPMECARGIFLHMGEAGASGSGNEAVDLEKCRFLAAKLPLLSEQELSGDVEKYIVDTAQKLMAAKSLHMGTFAGLLSVLAPLKSIQRLTSRQQLLEVVATRAGVGNPASAFESNAAITHFYSCAQHALPFFSKNVQSTKFVACLCEKVLPAAMRKYAAANKATGLPEKVQLLHLLAELTVNASSGDMKLVPIQYLFQMLLDVLPAPSLSGAEQEADISEDDNRLSTEVECVVFAFHRLSASHTEDFFTAPEAADRLADFRKRLQFFALRVQTTSKNLNKALTTEKQSTDEEETKRKQEALVACRNLSVLIRDLFRNPPQHSAQVTLSWKPQVALKDQDDDLGLVSKEPAAPAKRHTPITGPEGGSVTAATNGGGPAAKAARGGRGSQGSQYNRGRGGRGGFNQRGGGRGFYGRY